MTAGETACSEVAQLVEPRIVTPVVGGSIPPFGATNNAERRKNFTSQKQLRVGDGEKVARQSDEVTLLVRQKLPPKPLAG